jgi:hypothetical protein
MKLYHIFDEADSPRYFCDKVLAQLKEEMTRHNFEPNNPLLTKRNPFMARMYRKFPSPPPEAIMVQLETFESPITIYRFDAMQQLQAHLLRQDLYGNLDKLNVNPDDHSGTSRSVHARHTCVKSQTVLGSRTRWPRSTIAPFSPTISCSATRWITTHSFCVPCRAIPRCHWE